MRVDQADDEPDDADDELAAWEGPDESEMGEDSSVDTEPCPYCRKPICEGAERCPHCGSYISIEDAPRRYPRWIIVGVVLCLLAVLVWIVCWQS